MRTRILFLLGQLNLAGEQKRAVSIAKHLDPSRFEAQIVCLHGGGALQPEVEAAGIDLTLLAFDHDLKNVRNLSQLVALTKLIRERSPSIVHAVSYTSTIWGTIASRLASVPLLITSRNCLYDAKPKGAIARLLERTLGSLSHVVVTISEAVENDTIQLEGVPADKVRRVLNGVELGPGSDLEDVEGFRESLGLRPDDSVVVTVANCHKYKRHDTIIKAAHSVLDRRPNTKFLMVGQGSDELPGLKQLADDLGISDSIHWAGIRTDIANILSISDIGLLCSETEALGNSVLEYMDAGLPVVATRIGGIPEVVVHGETGWLISVGDHEKLAQHLVDLLDDPEMAQRMGAAGRHRIRTTFSRDEMIRGYTRLYETELERIGRVAR